MKSFKPTEDLDQRATINHFYKFSNIIKLLFLAREKRDLARANRCTLP